MPARFLKFWTEDRSLTALLILLAVNLLVLSPMSRLGKIIHPLSDASLIMLLLAGILTMGRHGFFRIISIGIVVLTVVIQTVDGFLDFPWLTVTKLAMTSVCFALILCVVARMVYGEGEVTGHRIRGAIALYLLIAAFFASLYTLLETVSPGAFRFPDYWQKGRGIKDVLAYFSFVTMTTVGYGDVTAIHPFARSLAMFEALIGQLYPAILLARLVSLYTDTSRSGERGGSGKTPSGE
jgi:Ion channel